MDSRTASHLSVAAISLLGKVQPILKTVEIGIKPVNIALVAVKRKYSGESWLTVTGL